MNFNKKLVLPLVALATVAIILTAVTAALLNTQATLPSDGLIQATPSPTPVSGGGGGGGQPVSSVNVEIYSDAEETVALTSLQWGTLSPGGSVNRTIYVKNTGNTAETLNMTATEWTPAEASSVLTLTWDKEGSSLAPGAVVAATVSLHVASNPGSVTSFSMNIIISGTA
jgi:hypothetical protein